MFNAKAYSAASATSALASTTIPRRDPTEHDVQIEILFCGICHSDLHQVRNEWSEFMPTVYPCVVGHEIVGRVTKVGSAVSKFKPGDLAAVGCMVDADGTCPECKAGLEQFCANPTFTYNFPDKHFGGVTYGGYSDSIVVDQRFVLRVPSNLDLAGAAPLLCAGITTYSPMRHWGVTQGKKVGVVGLGGLGNFGQAVKQMARYKQLTCPEEIQQQMDDEEWSIHFHWLLADQVEPTALIECAFAWVLSVARHGTGTRLSPVRAEFVQPRPHVKTIERHFGCPVVCGAPHNAIVFRAADAQRPFVTRNAELLAVLAPQFEEELKRENGDKNFVERVRITIQQKLTGQRPTIEDIADALHISSRTIQRRLQNEGSSFQRVLEEARHQLARQYLNNSVLELNEAAYLLGYNDANSFVRTFRTWEGVPPARWREEQRARAAS